MNQKHVNILAGMTIKKISRKYKLFANLLRAVYDGNEKKGTECRYGQYRKLLIEKMLSMEMSMCKCEHMRMKLRRLLCIQSGETYCLLIFLMAIVVKEIMLIDDEIKTTK